MPRDPLFTHTDVSNTIPWVAKKVELEFDFDKVPSMGAGVGRPKLSNQVQSMKNFRMDNHVQATVQARSWQVRRDARTARWPLEDAARAGLTEGKRAITYGRLINAACCLDCYLTMAGLLTGDVISYQLPNR